MKKRILSIMLTLCMVLMLVPTTVFAEMTTDGNFEYSVSGSGFSGVYNYPVVISDVENGKAAADKSNAVAGDKVTITVTPDRGYTLETIAVTDENGTELELTSKGDGRYTFTMPASRVSIKATFMEDNAMLNFFVDVPVNAYYYDAVLWAAESGITGGVDATHFAPDAPCTRGQAVTFLYRSQQAQGGGMQGAWMFQNPFTDVDLESYYGEAVMWAVANGITGGTSATTFSPDTDCTRGQIVAFLYRMMQ